MRGESPLGKYGAAMRQHTADAANLKAADELARAKTKKQKKEAEKKKMVGEIDHSYITPPLGDLPGLHSTCVGVRPKNGARHDSVEHIVSAWTHQRYQ